MKIEQLGRTFCASFDNGAVIKIGRIREQPNGDFRGQATFFEGDVVIHQTMVNVSIDKARKDTVRILAGRDGKLPWSQMFEQVCFEVCQRLSRGEMVQSLCTDAEIAPVSHLLNPVVIEGVPNLLFGDGGTFKSYLALAFGICALLPWQDNPLGLATKSKTADLLFLDWECDSSTINRRLQRLQKGFGLPHLAINYRQCSLPLVDDLEAIQAVVMETRAKFLIVDSLGLAAGNDLREQPTATAFFLGLRQLGITSLIITHVSKETLAKTSSPFGSVYFKNFARNVIEVKKVQEAGETGMSVALYNRKANDTPLFSPIGFRIAFDNAGGTTTIARQDFGDIPELDEAPLKNQMGDLLGSKGTMSVAEIAAELGKKEGVVRTKLNQHKETFERNGTGWRLK